MKTFLLWLQVTLEDNFATYFYLPIIFSLIVAAICYFGVIDIPPFVFLSAAGAFVAVWALIALRNLLFVRHSVPVKGMVGPPGRTFRGLVNHSVSYEINHRTFSIPHSFIKNEVSEGESILLLVHRTRHHQIRVLERARDKNSLLRP